MSSRWFRVPLVEGELEEVPKYRDMVNGRCMIKPHPDGNAPKAIVRYYADSSTLDEIATKDDVVELSSVPTQALNNIHGVSKTDEEWEKGYRVGKE